MHDVEHVIGFKTNIKLNNIMRGGEEGEGKKGEGEREQERERERENMQEVLWKSKRESPRPYV